MGKYDPLRDHLAAHADRTTLRMTFNEIAGLVGSLPASAWTQPSFWANDSNEQAQAWRDAGWHVKRFDQREELVDFEPNT